VKCTLIAPHQFWNCNSFRWRIFKAVLQYPNA